MSDTQKSDTYHLYAVTVGCPFCDEVTQFVVVRDAPAPIDHDIAVDKSHCPECGIHFPSVDVEWDLRAEHAIQTVEEHQ